METNRNHQPIMMIQTWHRQHPSATSGQKNPTLLAAAGSPDTKRVIFLSMTVWLLRRNNERETKKRGKEARLPRNHVNHEHTHGCWKQNVPAKNNYGRRDMEDDTLDIDEAVWSAESKCFPKRIKKGRVQHCQFKGFVGPGRNSVSSCDRHAEQECLLGSFKHCLFHDHD